MRAPVERTRYPLHVTISALFITLILGLGAVLSWQNYHKTSGIIFSSTETVYDKIANDPMFEFTGTYNPVADALRLFARSPIVSADSLEQRLQTLDTFQVALAYTRRLLEPEQIDEVPLDDYLEQTKTAVP